MASSVSQTGSSGLGGADGTRCYDGSTTQAVNVFSCGGCPRSIGHHLRLDVAGDAELTGQSGLEDGADLAVGVTLEDPEVGVLELVIVTGTIDVFVTTKVKVTGTPSS